MVVNSLYKAASVLVLKIVVGSLYEVYMNGRLIARDTTFASCTASTTKNPNLIFGGAASTSNNYWGMQIDDFAVWKGRLLTSDEIVYTMNKGE